MCFCFARVSALYAQVPGETLDKAVYWEKEGDWASAASYYEDYIQQTGNVPLSVCYSYAHCLRRLYEYAQAEKYYQQVWEGDSLHYPEALFYMAVVKKNNAKYKEAGLLFARYLQYNRNAAKEKDVFVRRAGMEVKACVLAEEHWLKHPSEIELSAVEGSVNSPYSEFNPRFAGDTVLYFSSLRPVTQNAHGNSLLGDYYRSAVYRSEIKSGQVGKARPMSALFNHPQYHNANLCISPDGMHIYLTRSLLPDPAEDRAGIWVSDFSNGKWQKPYLLESPVNMPGTVSSQPFSTMVDGAEVLYFVSDRPGGFGGFDIWYSIRETDGVFRAAMNAGPVINSPGNEYTPYYHSDSAVMYFSSDWYPGMGGFDIFSLHGGLSTWEGSPLNVGYPLNSPANDVYFSLFPDASGGCFASNRRSAYALSDPVCCNDIFVFHRPRKESVIRRDTFFLPSDASAVAAASLLPLTLYFHNDEPEPHSFSDTTCLDYQTTLDAYLRLESVYEEKYADGLEGAAADFARMRIDRFFRDSLSGGHARLLQFFAYLRKDLESGNRVCLTIDGHASPLFSSEYNMKLSSRRIQSLWNSMTKYEGGCFLPYMENGSLAIVKTPQGKDKAASGVSDNPNDQRNSVYALSAALERRIQITDYASESSFLVKETALPLRMPDTLFVVRECEGTDVYSLAVEVKNTGSQPMHLSGFSASSTALVFRSDTLCVKPGGSAYILLECNKQTVEKQMKIFCNFRYSCGQEKASAGFAVSFFRRK